MSFISEKCPLCFTESELFFEDAEFKKYCHCKTCDGIFLSSIFHLPTNEEKNRYDLHINDIYDVNYHNFVDDLIRPIKMHQKKSELGLDFGCGPSSVIQHSLIAKNYHILTYDPYYQPNASVLEKKFSYIVSCEVIEHFNQPNKSFQLLYNLLKKDGKLYLKTDVVYDRSKEKFKSWGYRQDPTHVFFYSPKTFAYIQEKWNYSSLHIDKRVAILTK